MRHHQNTLTRGTVPVFRHTTPTNSDSTTAPFVFAAQKHPIPHNPLVLLPPKQSQCIWYRGTKGQPLLMSATRSAYDVALPGSHDNARLDLAGTESMLTADTDAHYHYCCSHINSHNQVRGHRTASSHSGAAEYPRKNTHTTQGGTRIYHS